VTVATRAVPLLPHRLLAPLREHDLATYEHCLAVGIYAERLATALGLEHWDTARVRYVGQLHDVGKIAVPPALLRGTGPLSWHEATILRDHVHVGERIVAADPIAACCAAGVRSHHERLDGHGYPDRLREDQIPLEARIVAVADAFDALTRGRPYRPPETVGTVLSILYAARGRQMEGRFVDTFIAMIERDGLSPSPPPR
jgi:HD-GYP domain-containing protein (c-di-GMP phosphodiesterase class II)